MLLASIVDAPLESSLSACVCSHQIDLCGGTYYRKRRVQGVLSLGLFNSELSTERVVVVVVVVVVWGGVGRGLYLKLHCQHQNDFCIKVAMQR